MLRHQSGRPPRAGLRVALAALALLASTSIAHAGCISATLYDYKEFTSGKRTALSKLQYNTPVKLCITAAASGFVQVLDIPSAGKLQVLYPKVPAEADPDNAEYAPIVGNQEVCLGGDFTDDFVLFQPKSEGPAGTLAITVTLSEGMQLPAEDWAIPGRAETHLGSHKQDGVTCSGRDILYVNYRAE